MLDLGPLLWVIVVGAGMLVLAIAVGRDEWAERRRSGLEKAAEEAQPVGPHKD